jgi:4-hydroxy-3-polyprenylbenzoate decarboxylase
LDDLRDFIRLLEKRGELVSIDHPVDPVLEITEIADRVVKAGGPALLFRSVVGSELPVLINQFGSHERMCLALRTPSYDALAERVVELFELEMPQGLVDKVRALSRLRDLAGYAPKVIRKAPCQDVVLRGDDVDLGEIPVLQCWPLDGGRFITLPLVFTEDPVSGVRNAGMYRLQVYDARTTGMHWHPHKDAAAHARAVGAVQAETAAGSSAGGPAEGLDVAGGAPTVGAPGAASDVPPATRAEGGRLEVAVAIGTDPAVTYAATAPLPGMIDEMMFAGFLRGAPVEMVPCVSVALEVPAHAEIVLEGYVDLAEQRVEGPFGDHTGYYSPAEEYPVFHVTALTHRSDPIYATTIVGIPPKEDCFLAKATERLFLPLLRLTLPEVVDMDLPQAGVFHNCAIISIRKAYPMHARKVMHAVWGMGQMQFTKSVIVVDEDVDVHDYEQVAWRAFNNVDPRRDTLLTDGPLDALDHSSPTPLWGAKIGFDATAKWPEEGHSRGWPPDIVMSPEVVAGVDAMWSSLGIGQGGGRLSVITGRLPRLPRRPPAGGGA